MELYLHFSLDMDRSLGFGSIAYNLFALFRLALASAPVLKTLTLLHTITRRTILQKVPDHTVLLRSALGAWKHRVSGSFHSPPGVLFTFPSQYCFTIGHWVVFRLGGWTPRLPTGFLVSRGTLDTAHSSQLSPTCLSHSSDDFPTSFG